MQRIFGFIGCGNMGGALAKAVAAAEGGEKVLLADSNAEKAAELAAQIGAETASAEKVAAECGFVFIGVKPQVLAECFAQIKDALTARREKPTVVSMAAGVTIADIVRLSGVDSVIRIMPNLPVSVGSGVVLADSAGTDSEKRTEFEKAMSRCGVFDWLDESHIDAASAVSGCGPAFAYIFAQALADGAVACGLSRDKAAVYAAGMMLGSAKMLLESGKHPEKLKDEVCSPGGSTIMGVKALENGGFRSCAMEAVISAYNKTRELGK